MHLEPLEGIPIVFSAVDGEKLLVGISADVLSQNITYTEGDVQEFLGIDTPIEIKYMSFTLDSSTLDITSENKVLEKLAEICIAGPLNGIPIPDEYLAQCDDFLADLKEENIAGLATASISSNPCTDSSGSVTCYYYTKYIERCLPTHTTSRCSTYATIITGAGYPLPTLGSDITSPTITAPADVILSVTSTDAISVSLGSATTTGGSGNVVPTNNAPSLFSVGTNIVTWTATDDSGTTVTDTQNVTITYTAPLTITAPADVMLETNSTGSILVSLGNAVTTGGSGNVVPTNNAPSLFSVGTTTTVTWTATDDSGNTATDTQSVTITYTESAFDTTPPTITAPEDLRIETTNPDIILSIDPGTPVTSDDSGSGVMEEYSPSQFNVGTHLVTWTATDVAENTATDTQSVTVIYVDPDTLPSREIYGGMNYMFWYTANPSTSPQNEFSTSSIGLTLSDGTNGLVVSGHGVFLDKSSDYYTPYLSQINIDGTYVNISHEPPVGIYAGSVDAAFIPLPQNVTALSKVIRDDGSVFDVIHGNLADLKARQSLTSNANTEPGVQLSLYGIHSEGSGELLYKNATMHNSNGTVTFTNMGIALYPSVPGDSGAPIIHHNDEGNFIVGVHNGAICVFSSPSEGLPLDNYSSRCNDDTNTYKSFSAWENIIQQLDR